MMKAWVVETGLIPGEAEMREGLKSDVWGILTPNKNRVESGNIIVSDNIRDDETTTDAEATSTNLTPHKICSIEVGR